MLLFTGPTSPTGLATTWVVVLFIACATAYAFFQVPYVAMPAEMTDDYDERTRLMTWRVAILALTILVSGGLSPVIRNQLGPEWGYRGVGLFVGTLILIGTVGAWWGTRNTADDGCRHGRRQPRRPAARWSPPRASSAPCSPCSCCRRSPPGRCSPGSTTWRGCCSAARAPRPILFVCFVAPALLVTPLWQRVGERRDKRTGYLWGSLLLAGGALATLLTVRVGVAATAASVAVVGVGYAACQMFPLAMLPDVAAADTARTGESRAGTYTGVWTAGETLGLALGPLLYAGVLALGGYVSSTDSAAVQPASAHTAIALGFTIIPAALVAVSLLVLRRYRLDQEVSR